MLSFAVEKIVHGVFQSFIAWNDSFGLLTNQISTTLRTTNRRPTKYTTVTRATDQWPCRFWR